MSNANEGNERKPDVVETKKESKPKKEKTSKPLSAEKDTP